MIKDAENTTSVTEQTPTVTLLPQIPPQTPPPRPRCRKNYLIGGYHATTDKGAKYLSPGVRGRVRPQYRRQSKRDEALRFCGYAARSETGKEIYIPFEARKTAAVELLPRAIGLVHKKKAPSILTEFIKTNLAAIKTDDDWSAFYRHMNAINGYLVLNTADK